MRNSSGFDVLRNVTPILLAASFFVLQACSGGSGDDSSALFKENGIDTGSVSTAQTIENSTIPALGAALPAPINDDYTAARFLNRSTFGATVSDIERLHELGYSAWIADQINKPATFMLPETRKYDPPRWAEHVNSWLINATTAEDQLRQRVAFALSQFFVVSDQSGLGGQPAALSNYYDILVANSFGNFRELMEQVTLSPVMGDYLSMKGNQKPDMDNAIRPDENYARELLQLFSIGLVQMELDGTVLVDDNNVPLPTYDQEIVEAFAHVFTGWHFKNVDNWNFPKTTDWYAPMQAYDERHDKGEKVLLNGTVLPAGQSAEQDLSDALDNIFNHPNVAPFFAKHMIRQLVTSNPSSQYIERVSTKFNNDGNGVRGNIGAVVAATLLDDEALNGHRRNPETFGKLREPLIRLTSLWRAFSAMPDNPDFSLGWIGNRLNQAPLQSSSVFNFFSPSFSQAGDIRTMDLRSPEFQIHHESSIIDITNTLLAQSIWLNTESTTDADRAPIDITPLMLLDGDTEAIYELLGKLTLAKPPGASLRAQADYLLNKRQKASAEVRAEELLFLFVASPEAAVQR